MKQLLVPSIAALVLGIGIGHMIGSSGGDAPPVVVAPEDDGKNAEIEKLRDQVARLQRELEDARKRRKRSRKSAETEPETAPSAVEEEGATLTEPAAHFSTSVADAEQALADLLDSRNVDGLFLLAADLLNQGEEGFAKLIELLQSLEDADPDTEAILDEMFSGRTEELYIGRFFRMLADNDEPFLRFGLFLRELREEEGSTGSDMLDDLTRELTNDFGPVLLGFYDGEDDEVLSGYMGWYEERLESDFDKDGVFGLAQIRTEEATDVLISMAEERDGEELGLIVQALAWKGDPRALPMLRQLEGQITNARLQDRIRTAIRRLEGL